MDDLFLMIRACVTLPDEATPRLALADLIQERGEPARAARLRQDGVWVTTPRGYLAWEWGPGPLSRTVVWKRWPAEGSDAPACSDCPARRGLLYTSCPYNREINDQDVRLWLCVRCYNNRAADI